MDLNGAGGDRDGRGEGRPVVSGEGIQLDNDLSQAPSWLELPEEKRELWSCRGRDNKKPWWKLRNPIRDSWVALATTANEAIAHAMLPNKVWTWNGGPPTMILLPDALKCAWQSGCPGVSVISYIEGKWVEIARYPVGVPLQEGSE